MQIEEGKFPALGEGDDFAVQNNIGRKRPPLVGNFGKLLGDAFEIARENLDSGRAAMHLGANAVEFVLDVNHPTGAFFSETRPNGVGSGLGTGEHAFDWPKQ